MVDICSWYSKWLAPSWSHSVIPLWRSPGVYCPQCSLFVRKPLMLSIRRRGIANSGGLAQNFWPAVADDGSIGCGLRQRGQGKLRFKSAIIHWKRVGIPLKVSENVDCMYVIWICKVANICELNIWYASKGEQYLRVPKTIIVSPIWQ